MLSVLCEVLEAFHRLEAEAPNNGQCGVVQGCEHLWGVSCVGSHLIRDVTCREDQCRARTRAAPQVLAALRNTVLTIIRRSGRKPVEGFEHFAEHRQAALEAAAGQRTE